MDKLSKKQLKSLVFVLVLIIIYLVGHTSLFQTKDISTTNTKSEDIPTNMERALVSRVVDGDTLKIKVGDTEETVRLIGINTPETVDPRKTVECFGKEASAKMNELVLGKVVLVVQDQTQGERDKYQRLLAYIYLSDGTLVNQKMVEDGYAFEYTYNIPYEFQTEFKDAEKNAREKGLGLWDKSKCDYAVDLKDSSQK